MPIFYRIERFAAPMHLQQPLQRSQIVDTDYRADSQSPTATRGPVKHPLRQFERPARLVRFEPAAENGAIVARHSLDNLHLATLPGMPHVADFPKYDIMGLALMSSTTIAGRIKELATG